MKIDFEGFSELREDYYLSEQNIYGSSRIGMIKSYIKIGERIFNGNFTGDIETGDGDYDDNSLSSQITDYIAPKDYETDGTDGFYTDMRGDRLFEGKNHLGNQHDTWVLPNKTLSGISPDWSLSGTSGVLVVFSDRKIPEEDNGDIAYYTADVVSYNDYWPYGWVLDGRHGGESYRFSFQEQEGDDEIKGENNSINYKYRMHDTRIGRFFAVDPLAPKYPHNSPYAFSENRVIDGVELEGLEYVKRTHIVNNKGQVVSTSDILYYKMSNQELITHGGTPADSYYAAGFGPEGRGIQHVYLNADGTSAGADVWELQQGGPFDMSSIGSHGLYSGPGSITKTGNADWDFSFTPIDRFDEISKEHDYNYFIAAGSTYIGYLEDTRTLNADNIMVNQVREYLDVYWGFDGRLKPKGLLSDPVNGRSPSLETYSAAVQGEIFIGALAHYKTWKIQQMRRDGLDPNNVDHMNQVTLDDYYVSWLDALWDTDLLKQKINYEILNAARED